MWSLVVKSYPNTEQVVGHYEETHLQVAEMLHLEITHKHVVRF